MAATMSAAAGPAAFSATARPGPAQHTPAHHQFAGSSSHPSQPTQIKLVSRSSGSVPQLGANGLGPAGGAESGASGVGSGPAMMSGQGGAGNARPGFVQDILSGDEDAVLSFQLAVRYSLRLRGEKVATHDGKAKAKDKVTWPSCGECRAVAPRALLCLHCCQPYCTNSKRHHGNQHHSQTGHSTFVDLRACAVWDAGVQDYVYHPGLERLIELEKKGKRKVIDLDADEAPKRQKVSLNRAVTSLPEAVLPRGLRNLGQTCYMSVILQAFLHNPSMRQYFLGDRHNSQLCDKEGGCIGCEVDTLFAECYGGSKAVWSPTRFLYTVWQNSAELAGYAQQDAQEFLISTLNLLHSSTCHPSHLHGHDATCTCIAHATFGGLLRSEVTCGHCKNVSASTDPFLDLSLDLRARSGVAPEGGVMSLERCLERFTSSEGTEYSCARCGMQGKESQASKRLRLGRVPKVLAVHLKRFEHTSKSAKVEDAVSFPFSLDPAPFLADDASSASSKKPASQVKYRLHTVVVHIGSLSTGHYVAYVLAPPVLGGTGERKWYYTSDDEVREAHRSEVEKAKAYMLFYEQE